MIYIKINIIKYINVKLMEIDRNFIIEILRKIFAKVVLINLKIIIKNYQKIIHIKHVK